MYEEYWKLKEKPFENVPDPRFLYHSPKHEEALMRMFYAVRERKGAALLTGEYGSGKTILSRVLISELTKKDSKYKVALIVNPKLSPRDFLREILFQIEGTDVVGGKLQLLHMLNEKLYADLNNDVETVIIIDEAQAIDRPEVFEELRLLLNFQLNNRFLLTLILVGQPELKEKVYKIPQLEQRLAIRYHLNKLDYEEMRQYIIHRCTIAGRENEIFTDDACKVIYEASEGIPRRVNNLCDMGLIVGMMAKAQNVDEKIMQEVAEDFGVVKR